MERSFRPQENLMATGECNCGAVSYHIDADISEVYICHCSICRKTTGGAGFAVVVVDNASFSWLSGRENVSYWAKPGHDWHTSFCRRCGSPLPGANDDARMYVPVGTLTAGHEQLAVAHHIFVDSKAGWEEIADNGVQHPEGIGAR